MLDGRFAIREGVSGSRADDERATPSTPALGDESKVAEGTEGKVGIISSASTVNVFSPAFVNESLASPFPFVKPSLLSPPPPPPLRRLPVTPPPPKTGTLLPPPPKKPRRDLRC